jgi:Flp pilus assembly protein TadD
LAVRFIAARELWQMPLVRTPKLDSAEYVSWARRLAAGDFAWPVVSQHGPGYPLFLAASLAVGSGSLPFAIGVQAVIGALTATLVAAIARDSFGNGAAAAAGLAYALYAPAIYLDVALLSEGLLLFLLTAALLVLSRGWIATAGAALGGAILVRPTAFVIAIACAMWLLVHRSRTAAAVFATMCALVVAPSVAKNWSASRTLSLQGYGGLNVYIGNSPLHDGRPTFRLGGAWDALNAEPSRAGIIDPAAQDRYYLAKAVSEIRQQPVAYLRLLGAKLAWLVQAEEIRDSHSFYFFADRIRLLRILPGWSALFPLACVGFVAIGIARLKASRYGTVSLFLDCTLAVAITNVFLVVGFRYRMPLVPVLAITAGVGVVVVVDAVRTRGARALAMYAAAAVAAIAVSHILSDPRNRNLAEEWAFTGSALITEHDLAGAEDACRRAIALDPQSAFAWDALGLTLYDGGRFAEARDTLSHALALNPDNARALYHLALVDERQGSLDKAISSYTRAEQLSPNDVEITRQLAVALGMAGRSAEARSRMQRVVELDPTNGEAWLDLCLLSLDVQDVHGAAAALDRARELGAAPERLAFAGEALTRAQR